MEISGKVLREVEFRDRLRGYDTDEVDEFLEKVAVGVDALRAQLEALEARLAAQPEPLAAPPPPPAAPAVEDDTIRRTLVLAQRTADLAIGEAREEATRLVEEAKAEAEAIVGRAEDGARRIRSDAEQELHARVARLGEDRERLEREVRSLARLLEEERTRLTESLSSALRFVSEALSVNDEVSGRVGVGPETSPVAPVQVSALPGSADPAEEAGAGEGALEATTEEEPLQASADPSVPDVEQEIVEDAATAAWAPRSVVPGAGHVGPARPLEAVEQDADEALWERWAAGRDLGVVPGPADFGRRAGLRSEQDRGGWSA